MLKSVQLKRERLEVQDRMQAIHAKALEGDRDLLASEQREWDRLDARDRQLTAASLREEEHEAQERAGPMRLIGGEGGALIHVDHEPELLGARDSVREWAERQGLVKADEPSFGRWLQGAVGVGALRESIGTEGGFLTPVGVSTEILDLARAASVMTRAGALVRPIDVSQQNYPRLSQDPTASWVAEAATIPESLMQFEAVQHLIHKLATIVKITPELLEDSVGVDQFVRNALAQSFALALDAAGLRGDGVNKPNGIRDWSGVSIVSMGTNGATPTSFDQLVDSVVAVRGSNFEPAALIAAPRTFGTYAKLKDTTNQPLTPPDDVASLRRLSTTSIPTTLTQGSSTDTSEAYVADFSNYVFSVRVGFEIQVLQERYADQGQVGLLARLRADGSPVRDAAFAVVTGIRP